MKKRRMREYQITELMTDYLHIRLFDADFTEIKSPDWNIDDVQNSYWRFYLNTDPGASIVFEGEVIPIEPFKLYIIPAEVRFHALINGPVHHFFAHFDVIGLTNIAMRRIFSRPLRLGNNPEIERHARELALNWQPLNHPTNDKSKLVERSHLTRQLHLKSLLYESLASYLQNVPEEQIASSMQQTGDYQKLLPAIEYIEDHLDENLPVDLLAELCNLSKYYFIMRFRQFVGLTPGQYILEQRVKRVAQQLLFSNATLDEIAGNTGFANRNYMSRVFTRATDVPPAAYRKSVRR